MDRVVYWCKGWWRWWWQLDYWSCKLCKAPVKSSSPTNQHPVFCSYSPDALCLWPLIAPGYLRRPANSDKALKGKYHIPWTCLPQAHLGSSNFISDQWPLIAPGYLGEGLPCLSSALWCQYPVMVSVAIVVKYKTGQTCCSFNRCRSCRHDVSESQFSLLSVLLLLLLLFLLLLLLSLLASRFPALSFLRLAVFLRRPSRLFIYISWKLVINTCTAVNEYVKQRS